MTPYETAVLDALAAVAARQDQQLAYVAVIKDMASIIALAASVSTGFGLFRIFTVAKNQRRVM